MKIKNIKYKKFLTTTVPLSTALLININTLLIVGFLQHLYYQNHYKEMVMVNNELQAEVKNTPEKQMQMLKESVFNQEGYNTNIKWRDIPKRLVEEGAVDKEAFLSVFRSPIEGNEYENILSNNTDKEIIINESNSRFILNTLWALGLLQTSPVLSEGPMIEYSESPMDFASTGGWSVSSKPVEEIYGSVDLLGLSENQHNMIKNIAEGIYRPCCNNHTAFPDCNHGMAMLGLIELMVANGKTEDEIYQAALAFNTYWFPDQYLTIAKYMKDSMKVEWKDVDAQLALGDSFASGSGFASVKSRVEPLPNQNGGGGCGV